MLSYRHAFHAGNHADVLKHLVLLQLLDYMRRKDKPFWYIDTHAGAGAYSLTEGFATRNAEFDTGIARLWDDDCPPKAVARYLDLIRQLNANGSLAFYPGSPWLALQVMRDADRARLFELHPADQALLQANTADADQRAKVSYEDGFAGIKALLPPPSRRAVVLIDPSYEDKKDYQRIQDSLQQSLKRFGSGCYAIWYPLLQRVEARMVADRLKTVAGNNWLDVSLTVHTPRAGGFGMHGSGMFIVNPPFILPDTLRIVMPYLVERLGQDGGAGFVLDSRIE